MVDRGGGRPVHRPDDGLESDRAFGFRRSNSDTSTSHSYFWSELLSGLLFVSSNLRCSLQKRHVRVRDAEVPLRPLRPHPHHDLPSSNSLQARSAHEFPALRNAWKEKGLDCSG
jgi:hypothetical protein